MGFWRFVAIALLVFAGLLGVVLFWKNGPVLQESEAPAETIPHSPIALPNTFPQEHAGHILQATQKEEPPKGVKTYHAALYWSTGNLESEVSVRLLELEKDKADEDFAAIRRLRSTATSHAKNEKVKEGPAVRDADDSEAPGSPEPGADRPLLVQRRRG